MRRSSVFRLILVGSIALVLGCSTTDDPVTPPLPQLPELSGSLGAGGGTLTSGDGRLSLTVPPGALAAATDLRLAEVDPADLHPVFGNDFVARCVLELEPANLNLTAPAEVSFAMTAPARSPATGKTEEPELYDILLGICETAEGNRLPDQQIVYDLDPAAEFNFTITFQSTGWSQFAVGNSDSVGGKDGDEELGKFFGAVFGPDEDEPTPLNKDKPAAFVYNLTTPDELALECQRWHYVSPTMAAFWGHELPPGGPMEPAAVEPQPNNRVRYRFRFGLTPKLEGLLTYRGGIKTGLIVNIVEPSPWFLPVPPEPAPGQIDLTILTRPREVQVVLPDPAEASYTIMTGMTGLEGLRVAYQTADDPAPLGAATDPWLYVTGAEGIKYYRLVKNQDNYIASTELVGSIMGAGAHGVLPVSTGSGFEIDRCLFFYGTEFNSTTYWNPDIGEYGMQHLGNNQHVYDAVAYGGLAHSPGFGYTRSGLAHFQEYNTEWGMYMGSSSHVATLYAHQFPDLTDHMVSCAVEPTQRSALVLTSNGQIWFHARQDVDTDAIPVGQAQNDPKQIRGTNWTYAISNHGSNSLTTFRWGGSNSIQFAGTVAVGAGPHGIDVVELMDGTFLVVSTSATGNTYTLSQLNGSSMHIKSQTYPMPPMGRGPKHGVFIGSNLILYVALSCHDSGTVEIIKVDLDDFR